MIDVRFPPRATMGLGAVALLGILAFSLTVPSDHTLGVMFESDGQIDVATHYFQEWTRRHPSDYEARLHTAELLVMTVHPEKAVETLEGMTKTWPNDPQILRRLVEIEDSLLMVGETMADLERLAAVVPSDAGVLRRLADQYRWSGRSEPLLATLLKLVRLESSPEESAELTDILLSNRQYDTLIAWLGPHVDKMPDAVELRLALYEAFVRTGRMEEATVQLRRVLELSPDRVELLEPVADHLIELGMFDDAVALYRKRIDIDPANARRFQSELNDLYQSHAESLAQAGKLEEAVKLYRARIAAAPLDVRLRTELGELYGAKGIPIAIAELRQLLKLAPTSVEAWVALGERHAWQDDLREAVKAYQEAVRLAPSDRAIRRALAENLLFSDRTAEAIEQYEHLTGPGGDDTDREALIEVLIDADRGTDALAVARQIGHSPRRGRLIGLAALAAGDYEAALPELLTYTDHQSGDVRAWRALLDCATAMDDPELALSALRHLQTLEKHGRSLRRESSP